MSCKRHIREVLEKFFLITGIPIQAFQFNGEFISSEGYNDYLDRIFDNNNIYEELKTKLTSSNLPMVNMEVLEDVYYISSFVCPRNPYRGIFFAGPFSSSEKLSNNIPHKPLKLSPHLLALFRDIFKTCSRRQKRLLKDEVYGLHVTRAVDYIDSRYSDQITLDDISSYLDINKSYFCSIFKKETGRTFTQFLNEVRIEKSKELLLEGNLSILDVALSVGFNSQNYYNIAFKRITKKTPLEFIQESSGKL